MTRLLAFATIALVSCSLWASSSDQYNVRFSPVGLIVGAVALDFDFKVAADWTFGPEVAFRHYKESSTVFVSDYDVTSWGVAARATWFHNGVFTDGFYVAPRVGYANLNLPIVTTPATR